MESRRVLAVLVLLMIGVFACAPQDPLTPNAKEQQRLDAQLERVFAGIEAPQADRDAVRATHQLAYWIRSYQASTGHYPLSERLADSNFVQVFVFGNDSRVDYDNPVNIHRDDFLTDLRAVLGKGVELPMDPDPTDDRGLYYSTNGRGYTVACDVVSPVNGGEMVTAEHGQYRVASYSSSILPIHDFGAILNGQVTSLPPVQWRDPLARE
jgi:hypothetical protein